MVLKNTWSAFRAQVKKFARARRGNVAMIFALSLIPITIAAGAGLDLSRALMVRARLAEALDAAGLAIGATKNLTNDQITSLAQAYFNANYTADASFGVPASVTVQTGTQNVVLSTSVAMPTTLMRVAGIHALTVGYTAKIVWGQTKLWVSLVLDNTGSMCEPDSQPCTTDTNPDIKINALKTATKQLLTTLKGASATAGDVKVAIIPFSKDVNVGTGYVNASWVDWTDWESAPANGDVATSVGPGSACPYSSSTKGFSCQKTPTNGGSSTSTVPSSGTYKGYICPTVDNGSKNSGRAGRYYNGCYNSVPTQTQTTTDVTPKTTTTKKTCPSNSSGVCTGSTTTTTSTSTGQTTETVTTTSGYTADSTSTTTANGTPSTGAPVTTCTTKNGKTTCTTTTTTTETDTTTVVTNVGVGPYNHTWLANDHSTWGGCIMDRAQDYDISNTTPGSTATNFPAENAQSCVPSVMMGSLSYDWDALNTEVDNMTAGGNTNQPVGLAWGWQSQTDGAPFNPGTLPANTSRYIILLSDGLNTQDRWYSAQSSIDNRMSQLCANAKADGITIYTIYVDLNGTQGNSTVLQNCASDSSKYFDLTTSGGIITTLNNIAQQITQLRVSQ
ncbi:MAG TPA: pilus assembly protein [Rhizomicrobium sp.]|nr:pilus assembly protein [Rhizomicrobium sp.]